MEQENKSKFFQLKEKTVTFLREKGLYVTALLCLLGIGGGALLAYEPPEAQPAAPTPSPAQVGASLDERLEEARATPTPLPTPSPTPIATAQPSPEAATPAPERSNAPSKASAPVKGKLQWSFAVEELVYSPTLKQWMTHSGIDIAAAKGTEVHTPWGGTVDLVYEDDSLGVMVEVLHSGGLRTVYANLAAEPPVQEGQRLNAGDAIGQVGDTALAECAEPTHLHFEIYKDDQAVDPLDYILLIEE